MSVSKAPSVTAHLLEDDGVIPNNPDLPFLLYQSVLESHDGDLAPIWEKTFAANDWSGSWRYGVYAFPHYHSTAHEVLGVARGEVRLRLGGARGIEATVRAGDVIVIPAGGGHQDLGSSSDFLVVGAYPAGQDWDLCRGGPDEHARALDNIARVTLPTADPVYGAEGPLIEHWALHD